MINFEPRRLDPDDFWLEGPRRFGSATGTNMRIGRATYGILRRLGFSNISVEYVVVDPLRVPRDTFAAIWKAWRDGYADAVSTHTPVSRDMFLAHFEDMIKTIEDPDGYGVWARAGHRGTGPVGFVGFGVSVAGPYSVRNATSGSLSTLSAPGIARANPTIPISRTTPRSVSGSCGETPAFASR